MQAVVQAGVAAGAAAKATVRVAVTWAERAEAAMTEVPVREEGGLEGWWVQEAQAKSAVRAVEAVGLVQEETVAAVRVRGSPAARAAAVPAAGAATGAEASAAAVGRAGRTMR